MSKEYVLPEIYVVQIKEECRQQEERIHPTIKHFRRLDKKETIEFIVGVNLGFIKIDKKHKSGDELYIDEYSYCLE